MRGKRKPTLIPQGGNFADPGNSVIVSRAEIITGHAVQQSRISVHIFFSSLSSLFYSCDNLRHSTVQRLACLCICIYRHNITYSCLLSEIVSCCFEKNGYLNFGLLCEPNKTRQNIWHKGKYYISFHCNVVSASKIH